MLGVASVCTISCFLIHFPMETTLQIFNGVGRYFFRFKKPEGSDLFAQKVLLVFSLQERTVMQIV